MGALNAKKVVILLIHAFIIWALCGASVFIGRAITTIQAALIIHAAGAPVFAGLVSLVYYKKFNYTTPVQTAFILTIFIIGMDAGLVAPVFEKNFEMFKSVLGTWIPFGLIFSSTYVTGLSVNMKHT